MKEELTLTRLHENSPVMVGILPKPIFAEMKHWVKEARKVKDHPLGYLKAHENVGYLAYDGKRHNSYQCSIPPHLIDNSYWLAWVLRLCGKYYPLPTENVAHRNYMLRRYVGHFDHYDAWVNFAYKGDDNPTHNHAGMLSGVIYVQNPEEEPVLFDQYGIGYAGQEGTMVLFPSQTFHHVELKKTRKERVTIAFNIVRQKVEGYGA